MPETEEDFEYGEYEAPEGVVAVPATEALDYQDVDEQDTPGIQADNLLGFVGAGGVTPEHAIETARSWSLRGLFFGVGQCLATVRKYYQIPAGFPTATSSWQAAAHKHLSNDGRDAPRGAPVWWTGGSRGAGHVAISVGGGLCLSTDWARPGRIDYARINEITSRWGLDYKGHTNELNGKVVWQPAPPRATVRLTNVRPKKRNADIKEVKRALRKKGYRGFLVTSGYFGSGTRKAYAKYQRRLGYTGNDADGVPGRNSLRKLGFRVL